MTGKQLKEFSARVSDEAIIEVRERSYGDWEGRFDIQARIGAHSEKEKELDEAAI